MKTIKNSCIVLFLALTVLGCASLYDHFTYTETIETKLSTLSLMDKSDEPFSDYADEITDLRNQLKKMEIYEKGKNKNEITSRMWELLGSEEHLVGSYLKLWEEQGNLSPAFTEEAIPQIEKAYDLMLLFETKKDKKSQNALTEFIKNL
ncbi:MAG: hypothetical protein Mars2KO_05440 [Maribacter sp.]